MNETTKTKFREIKLTNSKTRVKEVFKPLVPGKVSIYSCGPTVYNFIHIGNLRAALSVDMIQKYFRKVGYDVKYVRNYTDIDDKIIKKANDEKVAMEVITKRFISEVERDYALAGMSDPDLKPKATEHVQDIIEITEKIITNKHAYVVDGEVFFSIASFPRYGQLSHKVLEDLQAGARVEVSSQKNVAADFTLWKPSKPGEPSWASPWGAGRPGWHIECSAMIRRTLGDQIDIHHGGEDLIFPHHENEVAQSECASGVSPFVSYWIHNAFLNINKEKMSKSLGNVMTARDFLSSYHAELARMLFLSAHYRSVLDFSDDAIEQALSALERIYTAKKKAEECSRIRLGMPDMMAETIWGSFIAEVERVRNQIDDFYANDFNTPGVFASLFSLVREFNRVLTLPRTVATPSVALGGSEMISVIEREVGEVLGVGLMPADKGLAEISRMRELRQNRSGIQALGADEIERLVLERTEAKKNKDFARGDVIRKELESKGIVIKDSPAGTTWSYK